MRLPFGAFRVLREARALAREHAHGWVGPAARALFVLQFALMFLLRPNAPLAWRDALAIASSLALAILLHAAARARVARVIVATVMAIAVTLNALSYFYFHKWLDAQLLASAVHNWADVRPVARAMAFRAFALFLAVFAIEHILLASARREIASRVRIASAVIFVGALLFARAESLTPELAIVHALAAPMPGNDSTASARVVDVPCLLSTAARPPNVLLVLLESVRYTSYCNDLDAPCDVAPKTRALFTGGVSLAEMRSVASYTAVSFDAILTGQPQLGSLDALQSMPTLFEVLHRATIANRPISTAYFSSQSEQIFTRASVKAAIDVSCTVESLVGHAVDQEDDVIELGVDRLLEKRVVRELAQLHAPYFAFVHVSGTHAPYFIDEARAPKKPYVRYASWSHMKELENAYDNAIFTQDESIANMISAFIDAQHGSPYVILLTSDHGEAFGEHAAIHHGQNLYDEQIHVPMLVTFGNDGLDDARAHALRDNTHAFVTHLDLLPTILDAFALRSSALPISGESLFSRLRNDRAPIPITDCTAMFPCPVSTWGMLGAGHALVAQPWDGAFHCIDLLRDHETPDDPACEPLAVASRDYFPKLPNGELNR